MTQGDEAKNYDLLIVGAGMAGSILAARIAEKGVHPGSGDRLKVGLLEWGIRVKEVLTDNGSCYVSHAFQGLCQQLGLRHIRTRPYRPQTNGKAERLIQTLLREWAYRFSYPSSGHRIRWLRPWLHFYNHHRQHQSLGGLPPISRLPLLNNVLRMHS